MIQVIKEKVKSDPFSFEKGIFTFLNPYSYILSRADVSTIQQFNRIFIDGEYLAKFLRIFCGLNVQRTSFDMTSLAPEIFKWCSTEGKTIAFIGSRSVEIREAVEQIQKSYPDLVVGYFRDGYFNSDSERLSCFEELKNQKIDVVVVGMGTPLQEQFLIDLWSSGWRGLGFTCGGFFHQTARRIQYYPRFFNKFNLRWVYRIYDEPKLLRRYTVDYSKFVFTFVCDWARWRFGTPPQQESEI